MFREITCSLFAALFLASSVIFPLGDLALMRDIPQMYQNYTKITSEEEMGVIDFIGDYLLHGKQIFGNNTHDKTPVKGNEVQFQHQANPLLVVFNIIPQLLFIVPLSVPPHPIFNAIFQTYNHRNKLLRPPLA